MGNLQTSRLNYQGHMIADKGDMLSLTDMWRAAGTDEMKRPSRWLEQEGTIQFIEVVAASHNVAQNDIIKTKRGKGGETVAHWQVALAYAKYQSHDFHMWCNQVVREHMESKTIATASGLTEYDKQILGNMIKNCTGVVLKEQFGAMIGQFLPSAVAGYIAEHNLAIADGVTAGEACDLAKVATTYPRGLSGRVSRRLALYCVRNGEKPRVTRLGRVRAQLFPTNLVREWLDIEGRSLIKRWIDEKKGQGKLRLVGGNGE